MGGRKKYTQTELFVVVITIFAILLAGIITYHLIQQSASPVTQYHAPTPYPTTDLNSSWQNYHNTGVGFSLSYPANWVKEEQSNNRPDFGRIHLDATEGSIEINWTTEPSVADVNCPKGEKLSTIEAVGMESVQISGETLMGCHLISTLGWIGQSWTMGKLMSPPKAFVIAVQVKEPLQQNKGILFKALSTLKLGE